MLQRILAGIGTGAVLLLAAPTAARAQMPQGKDVTIQGTVVDVTCKFMKGVSGSDHRRCGELCAAAGLPLAILGDYGKLYFPLGNEAGKPLPVDLKPHVDQKVTVKGKLFETPGGRGIVISSVSM
jgi:hypothetical protein